MKTQVKKRISRTENVSETENLTVSGGIKSVGEGVMRDFWEQFLKGSAQDVPRQIMLEERFSTNGTKSKPASEMQPGQEILLAKQEKKIEHKARHVSEYFRREVQPEASVAKRGEQMLIQRRIEEILIELKRLTKSSSEMQILFKEVTNEEVPVNAGTYHINFFEWVLTVVKSARQKIEDGGAWLKLFASKKKQKGYWNQFKKHGTSFALSGERTTATQTG